MADDDAVEAMYQMPGAEGDSARADYSAMPLASETPADVTSRQYQADTATRAYGRIKAADLNSRGIPSYTDTSGNAKPFVDDTGAPLTNSDPKNEIAYDSGGNAVKYSNRNPSLTPTVSDAYDGAPTQTDKQGNIYATPKGLPWVWQGQDPKIAAQAQQQQQDKLNQQTSNALAPYEQQAKIAAVQAQKAVGQSAKATQAIMTQSGASLSDPDGDPIDLKSVDGPTLKGAIQDSFDKEYAAPAANEKPWFGGGQYSSAATAIRADIDNRKQRAMTAADTHIDALTNAQQAGDAYDQIQQQRIQLASAKLDSVNQSRLAQGMEPVSIPGLEMAGPTGNNGQVGGPSGSAVGNAPATSQGPEQTAIPGLETSQAEPPANPPISQEDHQKIAAALPAPAKQALAPVKTDADGKVQPEGFWATAGRAFGTKIIPSVATAVGGLAAGTLASETGPGAIAADIAGGTAAGYGAAKAQRAIMGDQWANENDAQMAANAKAHPVAAQIGTIVPFLVSILGGGGGGVVKAGEEGALKLGTNTVTAAGKQAVEEAIATGTKAALPTAERVIQAAASGARGGGGEEAQDPNATLGSVADSMAKNALAFGATGLFAPAKTILQTVLKKPVSDALAMTLAGSMYDTAIHGQPFDIKKIAEQTGANIPAFVLQNALLGFLGHGMAAKSGESGGPEAKAGETPPEPQGGPTIPGIEPESPTKELSLDEIQKVFAEQLKNDPKPDAGNVIRHAPLEFTQLLNKKADSGAESAPMTAKGALEAVDTRLGAINELPDPGAASEEKTNLEDYRKVLVDALTGKEPSEEAPTSEPVRTEGGRQPETQAKGVQVEYAPEPKTAEPAKESPINEVAEKTGERLFTQPNLNAKGEHVGTDEVTDVGKTEDDNGKPVYQVNYEKNGEKKVGYSDNPAWEAHEKYRDAETRKADAAAKKTGVEYQGKSMGLHAFKEPETGGNFSIPEGDVTPEKVKAGADAVKKAFADNPILGVGEHTEADIDRAIALAKTPVKQNEKENTAASKGTPQTGGNESTPTGSAGSDAVRGGQASEITPEHAKSAVTKLRNGKLKPQFDLLQTRLEHLGPSASSAAQSGLRAQVNPNSQKIEILHDAAGTADSMKTVQENWMQRGLSSEDGRKQATQWLNSAMNEELIHARQLVFERGGPQFDKTYAKIWRDQIPEPIRQLVVALRNRKESDAERGAEYERMVIQQRETGTITEAHVGSPKYEQFYEALKPFLETPQSGPMEDNIARVMTLHAEHEEPEAKEEPSKEAEAKEAPKEDGRGPPSFSTAAQIGEYTEGQRAKLKGALAREYGIDEKQATVIMNGLYNDDSSDSQYERAHKIIEALKLSPDRNAEIEHHPEIGENGSLMPISNRFKASDIAGETDPAIIASALVNSVRLGGDKVQHTEQHLATLAALLRAKETGMSWSDIAKYLDELTTRNAGTMSGKEFLFSEWGKKVKAFADEYGIEIPTGDLEKQKPSQKPQRQLASSKPAREDAADQSLWMNNEAKARGFSDLGELLQDDPSAMDRMAKQWRAFHARDEAGKFLQEEGISSINQRIYGHQKEHIPGLEAGAGPGLAGSRDALRDASAVAGGGERAGGSAKKDRWKQGEALRDWAQKNGILLTKLPASLDAGSQDNKGGMEHDAWFDESSNRWIKSTRGPGVDMGVTPKAEFDGWSLFPGTPSQYLSRLIEANRVFGDDTRLHAVVDDGSGLRVVTSQPNVVGDPVSEDDMREAFESANFKPIGDGAFFRKSDNTAVFDMNLKNAVKRNGVVLPIDGVVIRPTGEIKEAIQDQIFQNTVESSKRQLAASKPQTIPGLEEYAEPKEEQHGRASVPEGTPTLEADNAIVTGPSVVTLRASKPIVAFHGTPHTVDRFSMEKVGTGEGNQVFGYGIYFAEHPAVAESYRDSLGREVIINGNTIFKADSKKGSFDPLIDQTIGGLLATELRAPIKEALLDRLNTLAKRTPGVGWEEALEKAKKANIEENKSGIAYTVNLNVKDDELIDWDKPLKGQSKQAKNAIRSVLKKEGWDSFLAAVEKHDAGDSKAMRNAGYNIFDYPGSVGGIIDMIGGEIGHKKLSQLLSKAGAKGIKYLDSGSRDTDAGTRNYVMFDDSLIQITHANGQPVALAKALAASKPERQPDTGKVGESESPVENLMREAEAAGVIPKTEELKGLIRQDPAVMAAIRAKIKIRTGEDALWAAKPLAVKLEELSEKVGLTSIIDDVQKLLSPDDRLSKEERMRFAETGDPNAIGDARKTGIILDEITAKMDRRKKQLEAALKETRELVSKLPEAQQLELMKRIDEGTPLKPGPFKDAFDAIGKMDADRTQESKDWFAAHGQEHWANYQNFIKNIVPHYFEDQTQATKIVDDYIRERKQMSGGTGFLKHREGVTMREIIDYAKSKGIDLKPKHTNVIDSIMDRWMQQERYFGAHEMIQRMVENGTGHWENSDYQPKANEKMVNNIIGNRTIEGPDGNRHKQFFYASEPSARIVNNYLSSGLRQTHKWIDNYFQAANVLNATQLGLSAFHAVFVSVEGMVSSFALGIQKVLSGDKSGLKDIATAPFSTIPDFKLGNDIRKTMLDPTHGGELHRQIVDEMVKGGFRDGVDPFYHDNQIRAFMDAFRQHKVFGTALRAPLALIELVAKPIMEHFVPKIKAAAIYKLASMHLKQAPNMTAMQLRQALQEDVRSGNNRMGLMTYDNLHLHKTVKELLMGMTRSLGWNWGDISEILGGVADWARFGKNAAKYGIGKIRGGGGDGGSGDGEFAPGGKQFPRITNRMVYIMALPLLLGIFGAILSAMLGTTPEKLKDYFFVKTKETDDHGNPVRLVLPSYMRDVFSWSKHPLNSVVNKLHPLLSMIGQMLQNRDFFGVEIRHSGDPVMKQILQELKYAGSEFVPFTGRNIQKLSGSNVSTPLKIATGIGLAQIASPSAGKSDAQSLADDLIREQLPTKARTQEQADHSALVGQITGLMRNGKGQEILQKSLASGAITQRDADRIVKQSSLTQLQASVQRLGLDDAEKVERLASPEEQRQLRPMIAAKATRAGRPMYRMSGF